MIPFFLLIRFSCGRPEQIKNFADCTNQSVYIIVEASSADFNFVTMGNRLDSSWETVHIRHGRAIDQHRNYAYIARQRRGNLQPNIVLRIVEPRRTTDLTSYPSLADQCYQYITFAYRFFNHSLEVNSRFNRVYVHKHLIV